MIECKECGTKIGLTGRDPTRGELQAFGAHTLHECPKRPGMVAAEAAIARASEHWRAIIEAVTGGATLVLTGPNLDVTPPKFGATLESATGARCANAYGNELGAVLDDLVQRWRMQ